MKAEDLITRVDMECRRPPEENKDTTPEISVAVEDEAQEPEAEEFLVCRQCRQIITRPSERVTVNGSHQHTFANPHGIVFEIGCFQSAMGCGHVGAPSDDFAWFAGYTWRIAVCAGCLVHLGWSFTSGTGDRFYGLILDQIVSSQ